jgi:hypothetical protein
VIVTVTVIKEIMAARDSESVLTSKSLVTIKKTNMHAIRSVRTVRSMRSNRSMHLIHAVHSMQSTRSVRSVRAMHERLILHLFSALGKNPARG